jgi:hypothetical protein
VKIYCRGVEDECEECTKYEWIMGRKGVHVQIARRHWDGEARWRREPKAFKCSNCGKGTLEWALEDPDVKLPPPDEEREPTNEELRLHGWGCEDDDSCDTCGLHSFDGEFPVCEGCGQCEDCGCDCEKGDEQ